MIDEYIPNDNYWTIMRRAMLCWAHQTNLTLGSVQNISFKTTMASDFRSTYEVRAWTPEWYCLWENHKGKVTVSGDTNAFERDIIALKMAYPDMGNG